MNSPDLEFTADEQRQLDLLVDGELDEAARRQLLSSFDERPGAWRRCALAFLEAQTISHGLSGLDSTTEDSPARGKTAVVSLPAAALSGAPPTATAEASSPRAVIVPAAKQRAWDFSQIGLPLTAAATFLIAFSLAWYMRPQATPTQIAGSPTLSPDMMAALKHVTTGEGSAVGARRVDETPATPEALTLVVNDNGQTQAIPLPVVESSSERDLWRDLSQPAVSPALRDALERLGHRVEEHRQLVPVNLRDGRQAIVPVDDIEFVPVSTRTYQ